MSETQRKKPKFVNITLEPGQSKRVKAFSAEGDEVVFQIHAKGCPGGTEGSGSDKSADPFKPEPSVRSATPNVYHPGPNAAATEVSDDDR